MQDERQGFVDEAQVHVRGGDGGAGAVSFRREAHVPLGGPDGGDGGGGGDVILEASRAIASLVSFADHPHRRATSGTHGRGGRRHGRRGEDLVVAVPEGTVVRAPDGAVLADLAHEGDSLLAARGGRAGRGNASFASNSRRAPSFAEQGEVGEERWLDLELKLVADVALVGFPNAGKSTLLSRISAARPKIANYPFTTLTPKLGVVRLSEGADDKSFEFVVADVPGLIEGASSGRGLGHEFLRHVERVRALVVLADLAEDEGRPPPEQVEVLLSELSAHSPALSQRPRLVVGSRADIVAAERRPDPSSFGGDLVISSATGEGIPELLRRLGMLVATARAERPEVPRLPVVHRPEEEGVLVAPIPGGFTVAGRAALRAVSVSDINNPDALEQVHRRLRRLGVDRALRSAGARDGDAVQIGAFSFTYTSDQ